MNLRRLSADGLLEFRELLDAVASGAMDAEAWSRLRDRPEKSQRLDIIADVDDRSFANRLEFGTYLCQVLEPVRTRDPRMTTDHGLWAWLAVLYFDQLCPVHKGVRTVGNAYRYIPVTDDYRKYYRHLVAGPYLTCLAHLERPESLRALLANPLHMPGDVYEQLASRQDLISNRNVVEAVSLLYYDPETRLLKPGAAGRSAGSARRLADVLWQFDCTWDLWQMDPQAIVDMLPSEFDRFKAAT